MYFLLNMGIFQCHSLVFRGVTFKRTASFISENVFVFGVEPTAQWRSWRRIQPVAHEKKKPARQTPATARGRENRENRENRPRQGPKRVDRIMGI